MTPTKDWSTFLLRVREDEDANRRAQAALCARGLARRGQAKQAGDIFYALGESASGTQKQYYALAAEQYRVYLEQLRRRVSEDDLRPGDACRMIGEAALWSGCDWAENTAERNLLSARRIYQKHMPESAERMALCAGALSVLYYSRMETDRALYFTLEGIELLRRWLPEEREWLNRLYTMVEHLDASKVGRDPCAKTGCARKV